MRYCAFADEADSSLDGQIAALRRNGINLIEIRGVNGINVSKLTREAVFETKKQLDDAGIAVWSIGSPVGKADVNNRFTEQLDKFKRLCETALTLGAGRMRIFSFFPDADGNYDRDTIFERMNSFIEAAPRELILCHENEKGIYGNNTENCLDILSQFSRLRAVFDPANFVQCGVDTLDAWNRLSVYVDYLHIKDATPDGTVVPAGTGNGNVKRIISAYLKKGGDVLTAEPHLQHFSGLSGLEHGEKTVITGELSQNDAFDLGVRSMKELAEVQD